MAGARWRSQWPRPSRWESVDGRDLRLAEVLALPCRPGGDGEGAAVGHGVQRIDEEVAQDLLKLTHSSRPRQTNRVIPIKPYPLATYQK